MNGTPFWKVAVYAAASAVAVAFALWTVGPLYAEEPPVMAYLRSDLLLFLAASAVTGVGVYSYIAFTRREHKSHRKDSFFLMLIGLLLLVFTVVVVLRSGGIRAENYDRAANAAVNLNVMITSLVPLPFLLRGLILAAGVKGNTLTRALGWCLAAAPLLWWLVMALTGNLLATVPYVAVT